MVGAEYDGRVYSRQLPATVTAESATDQIITLYDQTQDPLVVSIARIDLFVEAVSLSDWGSGLYVTQIIGIHNESDRIYTSGRRFDDGREAVLLLQFRSVRVSSVRTKMGDSLRSRIWRIYLIL